MRHLIKKELDRYKNGQTNLGSESAREMIAAEIEAVLISNEQVKQITRESNTSSSSCSSCTRRYVPKFLNSLHANQTSCPVTVWALHLRYLLSKAIYKYNVMEGNIHYFCSVSEFQL